MYNLNVKKQKIYIIIIILFWIWLSGQQLVWSLAPHYLWVVHKWVVEGVDVLLSCILLSVGVFERLSANDRVDLIGWNGNWRCGDCKDDFAVSIGGEGTEGGNGCWRRGVW